MLIVSKKSSEKAPVHMNTEIRGYMSSSRRAVRSNDVFGGELSPSRLLSLATIFEKSVSGELHETHNRESGDSVAWMLDKEDRLTVAQLLREKAGMAWHKEPRPPNR